MTRAANEQLELDPQGGWRKVCQASQDRWQHYHAVHICHECMCACVHISWLLAGATNLRSVAACLCICCGIHPSIVGAHAANAQVQEQGCWMLRNLAVGDEACRQAVVDAGGPAAAVAAMGAHASRNLRSCSHRPWRHMIVFFPHIWGLSKQTKNCALQELCSARTV